MAKVSSWAGREDEDGEDEKYIKKSSRLSERGNGPGCCCCSCLLSSSGSTKCCRSPTQHFAAERERVACQPVCEKRLGLRRRRLGEEVTL